MDKLQTEIEWFVIETVRKKREVLNMSQRAVSIKMGLDESYVGQVESRTEESKYNLNHLNELAKIFKCPISDFLPDFPIAENCIAEYKEIQQRKKMKISDKSGF